MIIRLPYPCVGKAPLPNGYRSIRMPVIGLQQAARWTGLQARAPSGLGADRDDSLEQRVDTFLGITQFG